MSKSQRTVCKQRLTQAIKYFDNALGLFDTAVQPYFERFPEKEAEYILLMTTMGELRNVMEQFLDEF